MSFQRRTYEKAWQAIERRDVQELQRLIQRPLTERDGERARWLRMLVEQAADAGLEEAVTHLAALNPVEQQTLLAMAWVHGVQQGHSATAHALESKLGFPKPLRFHQAAKKQAWEVVTHLLDRGEVPTPTDAMTLFESLAKVAAFIPLPPEWPRLKSLVDDTPEQGLQHVLIVAMRAHDEDLLAQTLRRMSEGQIQNHLNLLLEEAAHHDCYAWAKSIHDASLLGLSEKSWGESVIMRAMDLGKWRFAEDAWRDHPQALAYFFGKGYASAARGSDLVASTQAQDHDSLGRRQRLLTLLFQGEQLDRVKDHVFEQISGPRRDAALTRLAQWVPETVRERWFQEEPVTFGQAIADFREKRAANTSSTARRPRIRA